jgi:hypothetical protein
MSNYTKKIMVKVGPTFTKGIEVNKSTSRKATSILSLFEIRGPSYRSDLQEYQRVKLLRAILILGKWWGQVWVSTETFLDVS